MGRVEAIRGRKSSAHDVVLVFSKWSNFVPSSVGRASLEKPLGAWVTGGEGRGEGVENKAVVDLPFREGRAGEVQIRLHFLLYVLILLIISFLTTKAYLEQKMCQIERNSF